ncbi:hypothetical protein GJAV_G00186560 [Gymnothorax javanicus]|nr:hypothetical protein GJAV_G00186560 [Gymnothorax javanicus]
MSLLFTEANKSSTQDLSRSPQSLSDTGYSSDGISSSHSEITGLIQEEEMKLSERGLSEHSPPSPSEITKLESSMRPLLESKSISDQEPDRVRGRHSRDSRDFDDKKQRPRSLSITPEAYDSDEELEDILEEDEDQDWENQRDLRTKVVEPSEDFSSKLHRDYGEESIESGLKVGRQRKQETEMTDEEFMRRQILEMSADEDNEEDDEDYSYQKPKKSYKHSTDSGKEKQRRLTHHSSSFEEESKGADDAYQGASEDGDEDLMASQGGLRRFKTIELNNTSSYSRDIELSNENDLSLDREPELEMESLTGSPDERSRGEYSSTLPPTTPSYTSGTSPTSVSSMEDDSDSSPSRRQRLEEAKQQRKARHRSHGPLLPTIEDSSEEDELREEEELLREQEKMREVEQQRIRSTARKTKRDKEELRAQRRRERSKTPPSNLSPIEDASPTEELRQAAEMEELHRSSCSEYSPSIDSEADGFEISSKLYKSGSEYNLPTFMSLYSPTEKPNTTSSSGKPLKSAEEVYEEMMRKAEMLQKQQKQQTQHVRHGQQYDDSYQQEELRSGEQRQYEEDYDYADEEEIDYENNASETDNIYEEIRQTSQSITKMHQSSTRDMEEQPDDQIEIDDSYSDKQLLDAGSSSLEKEREEERLRRQQEQQLQLERECVELEKFRQMRLQEELERERLDLQRHREKEQMLVQREIQELQSIKQQVLQQQQTERENQLVMQREQLAQQKMQLDQIQSLQQQLQQQLEEQKRQKTAAAAAAVAGSAPGPTASNGHGIAQGTAVAPQGYSVVCDQTGRVIQHDAPSEFQRAVDHSGQAWQPYMEAQSSRNLPSSASDISLRNKEEHVETRFMKKRNASMPRLRDGIDSEESQPIMKRIVDSSVQTDDEDGEERFLISRRRRTRRSVDCSVQTDDEDKAEWEQPMYGCPTMPHKMASRQMLSTKASLLKDITHELKVVEQESTKLRKQQAELEEEEKEIDAKLRYLELGINQRKETLLKERERRELAYIRCMGDSRDYMSDSELNNLRLATAFEGSSLLTRPSTAPLSQFSTDQLSTAQYPPTTSFVSYQYPQSQPIPQVPAPSPYHQTGFQPPPYPTITQAHPQPSALQPQPPPPTYQAQTTFPPQTYPPGQPPYPLDMGMQPSLPGFQPPPDGLYTNLEQNIPRNYVMIDDISELTKDNMGTPSDMHKIDIHGHIASGRYGSETSPGRVSSYGRTEEESEEDLYDHHGRGKTTSSYHQRGSDIHGRMGSSSSSMGGGSSYYYDDYKHSTRTDKYGSSMAVQKHSSKTLGPAVVSSKRSKHRKQGMEQKISKFSPIEEAKDVESDLASYTITTSSGGSCTVVSRAKKMQDDITYGIKKNVYDQQKYYGMSSREALEEDDRMYSSGRSRSTGYGMDKISSRDSGGYRSKSYERDTMDRSQRSSYSRGRPSMRSQYSEEESPLSPVGKPMGVGRGSIGPEHPDSRNQYGSSHSLPDVQDHMKDLPRSHVYKPDDSYIIDDMHCAVSDSEAYHLGQEETDWFEKPRDVRSDRSRHYGSSGHSSSQRRSHVKHTYHDYDEPPEEDLWPPEDYSHSRHSSSRDHRHHGSSGRHSSSSRHSSEDPRSSRSSRGHPKDPSMRHDTRGVSSSGKRGTSDSRSSQGYHGSDYSRDPSGHHHSSSRGQKQQSSSGHHQMSSRKQQDLQSHPSSRQQVSSQQQRSSGGSTSGRQPTSQQPEGMQQQGQLGQQPRTQQQQAAQTAAARQSQPAPVGAAQQQPAQAQQLQTKPGQAQIRQPQASTQPATAAKTDTALTPGMAAKPTAAQPVKTPQPPLTGIGSKAAPRPGGIGSAAVGQPGPEGESVLSKILPGGAAEQAGKLGEAVSAFGKKFTSFW